MAEVGEERKNGSRQIQGSLVEGQVVVSRQEEIDFLSGSGYGVKEGAILLLQAYEALYLATEKRLRVVAKDAELNFQDLLKVLQKREANVWAEFLLFRDLRERGYVVREGPAGEVSFRVYERGSYPKKAAKYIVFLLREGCPATVDRLWNAMRLAQGMKKKLIVAVMDRRGEVVYYSLDQFSPA
jgi:tRNA-intron endonuclease